MSKKIIVTGSTGQDGSYMVDYLLENLSPDDTIIAAARRTSQSIDTYTKAWLNKANVKMITLDLADPVAIQQTIKEWRPDYFINFGAQTFVADSWKHPAQHMQINAISLIHILEAVKEYSPQCRVYSAGSSEMFGDVKYSPQDELHPMSPRSVYGVSKCAAGHICKVYRESYGLYVVHGTLFNHESPRRQEYFVTRKITKGVAEIYKQRFYSTGSIQPIRLGNVEAKRDWSHAKDFVDGVWKMLNNTSPKDYVLSSMETHSVKEFVELAFAAANIKGTWTGEGINTEFICQSSGDTLVKIDPQFYRPAEVDLLWGDSTLARKELGWNPKISFHQLVKTMVDSDLVGYEVNA